MSCICFDTLTVPNLEPKFYGESGFGQIDFTLVGKKPLLGHTAWAMHSLGQKNTQSETRETSREYNWSIYCAWLLTFRQRGFWSLRNMIINLFTTFLTLKDISFITLIITDHRILRGSNGACRRRLIWFPHLLSQYMFFQTPKVIQALPWMLMNKQLLSDNTDTNRSA
jgi:hypothetical protein